MVVFKGRVIDGNGGTPIEEGLVAVDGNKILYVGEAAGFQYPQDAEVITVPNGTIMPGFIEGHCHLGLGDDYLKIFREHTYNAVCRTVKQMETLLECGFTSMRECGGLTNYLKPSWSQGVISGPRIFLRDVPLHKAEAMLTQSNTILSNLAKIQNAFCGNYRRWGTRSSTRGASAVS